MEAPAVASKRPAIFTADVCRRRPSGQDFISPSQCRLHHHPEPASLSRDASLPHGGAVLPSRRRQSIFWLGSRKASDKDGGDCLCARRFVLYSKQLHKLYSCRAGTDGGVYDIVLNARWRDVPARPRRPKAAPGAGGFVAGLAARTVYCMSNAAGWLRPAGARGSGPSKRKWAGFSRTGGRRPVEAS